MESTVQTFNLGNGRKIEIHVTYSGRVRISGGVEEVEVFRPYLPDADSTDCFFLHDLPEKTNINVVYGRLIFNGANGIAGASLGFRHKHNGISGRRHHATECRIEPVFKEGLEDHLIGFSSDGKTGQEDHLFSAQESAT